MTSTQTAVTTKTNPAVVNGAKLKDDNVNDLNIGLQTQDVPLTRIRVKEGFNPRVLDKPETKQKIKEIAESFKAGRHVPPIEVSPSASEPGIYEIVDGECRFTAAQQAKVEELSVIIFKGDDQAKLIHTFLGNEGEPLTPLEQITIIDRLKTEFGMKRDAIAKTLGKSVGWIDRLIKVNKLPDDVKELLSSGKVSMDVVLKFEKEHGEKTGEALAKLLAGTEPSKRVTTKDTRKDSGEEKEPTKAQLIREAARSFTEIVYDSGVELPEKKDFKVSDEVTLTLPGRAVKVLLDLMEYNTVYETVKEEKEMKAKGEKGEWPFEVPEASKGKSPAKKEPKKAPANGGKKKPK